MVRFNLGRSMGSTGYLKQSLISKKLFALLVITKKIKFKVSGASIITMEVAKIRKGAKSESLLVLNCLRDSTFNMLMTIVKSWSYLHPVPFLARHPLFRLKSNCLWEPLKEIKEDSWFQCLRLTRTG